MIHTVALCLWRFLGSCVLCKKMFSFLCCMINDICHVLSMTISAIILGSMSHLFTFSSRTVPFSLLAFSTLLLRFSLLLSCLTVTINLLVFSTLLISFSLSLSFHTFTHSLPAFSTLLLSFGATFCILKKSFLFPLIILFSCDILRRSFCILSAAGLAGFLPSKNC
jgi:hypothetical protein